MLKRFLAILCAEIVLGAATFVPRLPVRPQIPLGGITASNATAWVLVQSKYFDKNGNGTGGSSCANTGTTCIVNTSAVGAGHVLVAYLIVQAAGNPTLSSISGETTLDCAACLNTAITGATIDIRYVLSTTGGETSITCNLSASSGGYQGCGIKEYAPPAGTTVNLDTGNFRNATSCSTTCAGVGLTLCGGSCSGSPDAVLQLILPNTDFTSAISAPYVASCIGSTSCSGTGTADSINTASGTAPNWTLNSIQNITESAIAFQATPNSNTPTLLTSVTAASADCTSNITTGSINTTGATFLLIAVAQNNDTSLAVSDNSSNTWTALTQYTASAFPAVQMFYVFSPTTSSSHTFSISSMAGDNNCPAMAVLAFKNMGSPHAFDAQNGSAASNSTSTQNPGSITPARNGELLIAAIGADSSTADTINSSFTVSNYVARNGPSNWSISVAYFVQSTAAAINPTWTLGTQGSTTTIANTIASF